MNEDRLEPRRQAPGRGLRLHAAEQAAGDRGALVSGTRAGAGSRAGDRRAGLGRRAAVERRQRGALQDAVQRQQANDDRPRETHRAADERRPPKPCHASPFPTPAASASRRKLGGQRLAKVTRSDERSIRPDCGETATVDGQPSLRRACNLLPLAYGMRRPARQSVGATME